MQPLYVVERALAKVHEGVAVTVGRVLLNRLEHRCQVWSILDLGHKLAQIRILI